MLNGNLSKFINSKDNISSNKNLNCKIKKFDDNNDSKSPRLNSLNKSLSKNKKSSGSIILKLNF